MLNAVNVNEHTETKNDLTYLSWAWAWAEVKKHYPQANYTIWKDENGRPYTYDPLTGFMVYTTVTIENETHEMWLPVMDGANKAMKAEPYEYDTRYGKKKVEAATMFDVNKTIMRCLVKNLAMFGLGLYIYAGEDLPEASSEEKAEERAALFGYIENCETEDDIRTLWSRYRNDYMKDQEILSAFGARRKAITGKE